MCGHREDRLGTEGSLTRVSNMTAEARTQTCTCLSFRHVLPEQERSASTYSHVHVSGQGVERKKQLCRTVCIAYKKYVCSEASRTDSLVL